jgi:hypothetical protein
VKAKRTGVKQRQGDNIDQSAISVSQRPSRTFQKKPSTNKHLSPTPHLAARPPKQAGVRGPIVEAAVIRAGGRVKGCHYVILVGSGCVAARKFGSAPTCDSGAPLYRSFRRRS